MKKLASEHVGRWIINGCLLVALVSVLLPQIWPKFEAVSGPLAILCATLAVLIYMCGSNEGEVRNNGSDEARAKSSREAQGLLADFQPAFALLPANEPGLPAIGSGISHSRKTYSYQIREHDVGAILYSYLVANKSVQTKIPQTEKLRQLLEGLEEDKDCVEVTIGFVTIRLRGEETELHVTPKKVGYTAVHPHKSDAPHDARLTGRLH